MTTHGRLENKYTVSGRSNMRIIKIIGNITSLLTHYINSQLWYDLREG